MIDYDKEIDKQNIEIFKKYGTDDSGEFRHKCCICKEPTCIDNSYSNGGHKLICNACRVKLFGDRFSISNLNRLFDWQQDKEE